MTQDIALSRRAVLAGLTALAATPVWARAKLNIVTTTGRIADLVRQIGGEAVAVQGLMGAGVDPHAYRQTRSDIVAMTRADAVLWNGLYLEAQMEDFLSEWVGKQGLTPKGDFEYAFYDAPMVPGQMRRNEVLIEVVVP